MGGFNPAMLSQMDPASLAQLQKMAAQVGAGSSRHCHTAHSCNVVLLSTAKELCCVDYEGCSSSNHYSTGQVAAGYSGQRDQQLPAVCSRLPRDNIVHDVASNPTMTARYRCRRNCMAHWGIASIELLAHHLSQLPIQTNVMLCWGGMLNLEQSSVLQSAAEYVGV